MCIGLSGMVDDLTVQMGADQADFMPIFPGRESDGLSHHAGANDGDDAHCNAPLQAVALALIRLTLYTV